MPFKYANAPVLIANDGTSDVPALEKMVLGTNRSTLEAKFSSRFRAERNLFPPTLPTNLWRRMKMRGREPREQIANCYSEALPYPPPKIDQSRAETYKKHGGRLRKVGTKGSVRDS